MNKIKDIEIKIPWPVFNGKGKLFYRLSPTQQKYILLTYKEFSYGKEELRPYKQLGYRNGKRLMNKPQFKKTIESIPEEFIINGGPAYKIRMSKQDWCLIYKPRKDEIDKKYKQYCQAFPELNYVRIRKKTYDWIINTKFDPIEMNMIFLILAHYGGVTGGGFNKESFTINVLQMQSFFNTRFNRSRLFKSAVASINSIWLNCPTKLVKDWKIRKAQAYKGEEIWIKIR